MSEANGRRRIFGLVRPHIRAAAAFSVAVNILFLVSPLYMLQVYDRVLTTGSIPTLILLSAIAVFLLVVYLFAEAGRRRVMARAAEVLNDELGEEALKAGFRDPKVSSSDTVTAVQNLAQVQQALNQGMPGIAFDLPFVPLFLIVLFIVHPLLGLIGLLGAAALVALAVFTERLTKTPMAEAQKADRAAQSELGQLVRQRGAIAGMGMADRAVARWSALRRRSVEENLHAGNPATYLGAATRALRMILQIAILGAGAFLAVIGVVSPGAMIAASIIMGRALAPIDQAVNTWRQLLTSWAAFKDTASWLGDHEETSSAPVTPMPRPEPQLQLEELQVSIPGADKPLLAAIDKSFERGRIVALLGQSGSGKTSLLQTLAAAWPPFQGTARLGARDLWRWDPTDRGRFIGYLPQHVELLRGTVRENIARFTDAPPEEVFKAAQMVGCHELIMAMPDSYDTRIGEGGVVLSAGQRQAVGLARAFFGTPPLVILDEPTAHLDARLTEKLMDLFARLARLPATERPLSAIVATHDMRLLNAADDVMTIDENRRVEVRERGAFLEEISEIRRQQAAAQQAQQQQQGTPLTVDMSRRPDNG